MCTLSPKDPVPCPSGVGGLLISDLKTWLFSVVPCIPHCIPHCTELHKLHCCASACVSEVHRDAALIENVTVLLSYSSHMAQSMTVLLLSLFSSFYYYYYSFGDMLWMFVWCVFLPSLHPLSLWVQSVLDAVGVWWPSDCVPQGGGNQIIDAGDYECVQHISAALMLHWCGAWKLPPPVFQVIKSSELGEPCFMFKSPWRQTSCRSVLEQNMDSFFTATIFLLTLWGAVTRRITF